MAKSLALTVTSLLVIWLAMSVGTWAHLGRGRWGGWLPVPKVGHRGGFRGGFHGGVDVNDKQTGSDTASTQGSSLQDIEQKLQLAFEVIQQGKQAEGQELLKAISIILARDKSVTVKQKEAKLTECVQKVEKSLNKETKIIAQQFLQGAQMGFKISIQNQVNIGSNSPAEGSSQSMEFFTTIEQKLQEAFQVIQQGKQDEGQELLKAITNTFIREQSITAEQKVTKLTECVKKIEQSLNKETQAIAEQFLQGAITGFKISCGDDTSSGTKEQGSFESGKFMIMVEQKLQAAFEVIQQGKQAEGEEMLIVVSAMIAGEKSIHAEQKTTQLKECVKKIEKSIKFNTETKAIAEQFLEGAKTGFVNFSFQQQTDTSSSGKEQGSSQNGEFMTTVEQKLQAAFETIQQGKQVEGQEMLIAVSTMIAGEKSIPVEQKKAQLKECMKKIEKSIKFNTETRAIAKEFIQGAKTGFVNFSFQQQTNTSSDTKDQGSPQSGEFMKMVEQKLQAAFEAIQQGKQDEGQEILKVISTMVAQEQSLPVKEKMAKLKECVKKIEKSISFNTETKAIAREFLQGAKTGFVDFSFQQQTNTSSSTKDQGSSQDGDFMITIEQKLQAACQAIQQGKQAEGQDMLKVISTMLKQEQSITPEQKTAKFQECVNKVEKSFDKETIATVEKSLQDAQMGFKVSFHHQVDTSSGTKVQESSLSANFILTIEQKLQEAFQAIQQGKQAEGQEMLSVITTILAQEQSITPEQKTVKLTECVKKAEKSLNKETQMIAQQFLQGALKGFTINFQSQYDTSPSTKVQGNEEFLKKVEQKLLAAFEAIQQGKKTEGQEILTVITITLAREKSVTPEQKTAKLTECVKKIEKSLNKDAQVIAEQFLQGALKGFTINSQHQGDTSSGTKVQGSPQTTEFMQNIEQTLQAAFQAIQQGKQAEGQEMLRVITTVIVQEKSIPAEQKTTKLVECVNKIQKSLNKEAQEIAKQFLQGALLGFKVNLSYQDNTSPGPST